MIFVICLKQKRSLDDVALAQYSRNSIMMLTGIPSRICPEIDPIELKLKVSVYQYVIIYVTEIMIWFIVRKFDERSDKMDNI